MLQFHFQSALLITLTVPGLAADYTQSLRVPEQQQQLIAQLQDTSARARIAAQENKTHPPFAGKSYENDSLIQRIQSGMMVSPIEIEQALTPVSVQ
jgi:hypothetical protein